jgi:hypothetical protein
VLLSGESAAERRGFPRHTPSTPSITPWSCGAVEVRAAAGARKSWGRSGLNRISWAAGQLGHPSRRVAAESSPCVGKNWRCTTPQDQLFRAIVHVARARCSVGPCRLGTRRLFPVWADGNPPAMRMAAIPPDPPSPPPISRLLFRCSGIRACCYAYGDGGTKRAFHICRAIPEATRVARAGPQKLGLRQSNEICGGHASIDCGLCPEQAIECRVLPHSAPSSNGLL